MVTGFQGVYTGIKPNGYSVSINQRFHHQNISGLFLNIIMQYSGY